MDVGFIVFAPAFILLAGYAAPLVMLGICLVAIAEGLAGTGGRVTIIDEVAAAHPQPIPSHSSRHDSPRPHRRGRLVRRTGQTQPGRFIEQRRSTSPPSPLCSWRFSCSTWCRDSKRRDTSERAATALILFIAVTDFDGVTIFAVSEDVGPLLPWLIFLAAIGSQTSGIVNAPMSRSDMMVEAKVPRRLTFPIILIPALAIFILVDVAQAVALASRVFAAYFATQALIAAIIARRKRNWAAVAGFAAVGAAMFTVMIFGLPVEMQCGSVACVEDHDEAPRVQPSRARRADRCARRVDFGTPTLDRHVSWR